MDKIKKFLVDNKGCPLTPAATKQLFTKFLEFLVKEGYGEELESLKPFVKGMIKVGSYILDENNNYILVDELPVDYSGPSISIDDDGYIYITNYDNGNAVEQTEYSSHGVDKVQPSALVGLTHSFNELEPTLKAIVDAAIVDAGEFGVACSQQQWGVIKQLLDKSLYLNYSGCSLIKGAFDGINSFSFGSIVSDPYSGIYSFNINYSYEDELLFIQFLEL